MVETGRTGKTGHERKGKRYQEIPKDGKKRLRRRDGCGEQEGKEEGWIQTGGNGEEKISI